MQITCPVCKKKTTWEENPWRPFCSERCKLIDLGKWASGEYKVQGDMKGGLTNDKDYCNRRNRKDGEQDIRPFKGLS
jgi:endogenous inhibitor of DNA gyrase (YacG/DUF329 family)